MSYENVQFVDTNMTGDRENAYLYSFTNGLLYKKDRGSVGTPSSLVATYPTDTYLGDVVCGQFDGYYYWSMEKQTDGITIRKWELVSGILKQRSIFSFANNPVMNYDADCFVVDSYSDSLQLSAPSGSISITVNDPDVFNIGDTIVLGPSTDGNNPNEYESVSVSGKSGDVLTLDLPLTKYFDVSDPIYTTRYFYVFNKHSPFDNTKGSLLKYEFDTGNLFSFSSSHMFGSVVAGCFYDGYILFVKGNEVIFLAPTNLSLYKHMAIDNLDLNRADTLSIYALWCYSDVLYRLQDKYVFFDGVADDWDSEEWSSVYNWTTSSLVSSSFFIEVFASPMIIHTDGTANITVKVLDQYRTPLQGKTISLTSSVGSLSPTGGTTDSNGELTSVYTGTSSEVEVEIKAEVL